MSLPQSFAQSGFVPMSQARKRVKLCNGRLLKPLMIGTEGPSNSGKSEFILSCPDPGALVCIDRGIDGCFDNPTPPTSRRPDWAFSVVAVPPNTSAAQPEYVKYFTDIRNQLYAAASNPDCLTVGLDCHNDFWELHRLASLGKLTGVMPLRYTQPYAEHRAILSKLWDSGKIIIGTNKVRDEYEDVIDASTGLPQKEADGTNKRRKTGNYVRQGFPDQDYLWQIQIQHLYQDGAVIKAGPRAGHTTSPEWGIRILKCKPRPELKGQELWGGKCNFQGLVELVYPQVPPEEFGL